MSATAYILGHAPDELRRRDEQSAILRPATLGLMAVQNNVELRVTHDIEILGRTQDIYTDIFPAQVPGLLEFRVTVEGRAPDTSEISHTAFAHRAVNPLDKLVLIHRALQALDARRAAAVRHPALQKAIGRSTNLLVSHMAAARSSAASRIRLGRHRRGNAGR